MCTDELLHRLWHVSCFVTEKNHCAPKLNPVAEGVMRSYEADMRISSIAVQQSQSKLITRYVIAANCVWLQFHAHFVQKWINITELQKVSLYVCLCCFSLTWVSCTHLAKHAHATYLAPVIVLNAIAPASKLRWTLRTHTARMILYAL